MTPILGLAVASDCVSAVLVRGASVTWNQVRPYDGTDARHQVIGDILAACPKSRWRRPHVIVAIGPSGVQVKRVAELPPALDPRDLNAIVREGAGRFFIKNGVALETRCTPARDDGTAWAAAYDAVLIEEIERACRAARRRLLAVVPVATSLRLATSDESFAWEEGDVRIVMAYRGSALAQVRCARVRPDESPLRPPTPRRIAASVTPPHLAAFAATQVRRGEPLAVRRPPVLGGAPSRRQVLIASLCCVLALLSCWLTPALVATMHANRAERALSRLAGRASADRRESIVLDSLTGIVQNVAAFRARARSMALVLAEITRALPDSCAIVQLQLVDSSGESVVAVGPQAAEILDALERVPTISGATIAGPVASETIDGRTLDRVSVTFRLARP